MRSESKMLKDFAICLSLASLCFLDAWKDLLILQGGDLNYFRKVPPTALLLATTFCNVLLLSALCWLAITLVRRSANAMARRIAQSLFLVTLVVPLNHLRSYLLSFGAKAWITYTGTAVLGMAAGVCLYGALLVLLFRNQRISRVATTGVFLLALFFPVSLVKEVWSLIHSPPLSAFADKPLAPPLPARASGTVRVLWLVFDELDQRLTFLQRPTGVEMPEMDRFRREALYATNARPPSNWTKDALPALICGRLVSHIAYPAADELLITFKDSGQTVPWSAQPNVFSRAREAGVNTALVGWYHPYCRVINASLTSCAWQATPDASDVTRKEEYARRYGLWASMRVQACQQLALPFLYLFHLRQWADALRPEYELMRQVHQTTYLRVRRQALEVLASPNFGLVLLHWPVPHPLGIYDRFTNRLSLDSSKNYADNLELADRTLGEVRRALEHAGMWDNTAILLSSDHPLRPTVWNSRPTWTAEMVQLTEGGEYPFIPFLLKLPGQKRTVTYQAPFSTVLSHDLILALLRRELSRPEDVVRWLDRNRSRFAAD